MTQPLTVLSMPESAYGPTNNCIGIGDVLRRRGHRVGSGMARSRTPRSTVGGWQFGGWWAGRKSST
ncbi:MAG: hypothetical protein E6I26_13150 [Chloroflexi bacterium]|nr:MAG: hypothetical protein E6I26_13150 [Chloroflexota bacterium]